MVRRGFGLRRPRARRFHPPTPECPGRRDVYYSNMVNPRRPQAHLLPRPAEKPPPGPICLDNKRKCFKMPPGRDPHPLGVKEPTPPGWVTGSPRICSLWKCIDGQGKKCPFELQFRKDYKIV